MSASLARARHMRRRPAGMAPVFATQAGAYDRIDHMLDDLDRAIADLLSVDGRMSSSDLARRLGAPEPTVRRRLRRPLAEGGPRVLAVLDPARTPDRVDALIGL